MLEFGAHTTLGTAGGVHLSLAEDVMLEAMSFGAIAD
jgi:hypothetical protein